MNDLLRKCYFGQLLRSISLKRIPIGLYRSKHLTQDIASSRRPSFSDSLQGVCPGMNDLSRKRYFGQPIRSILLKRKTIGRNRLNNLAQNIVSSPRPSFADRLPGVSV